MKNTCLHCHTLSCDCHSQTSHSNYSSGPYRDLYLDIPDPHQDGFYQEGYHQDGSHQEGLHQDGLRVDDYDLSRPWAGLAATKSCQENYYLIAGKAFLVLAEEVQKQCGCAI